MNKALCNEVIDYLTTWKEAFLNESDWSFEKKLGIEYTTDLLDGISENEGEIKCDGTNAMVCPEYRSVDCFEEINEENEE